MNDEQIRQLMRRLGIVLECPRCGHKYNLEDISLRSYSGPTYNLKLVCSFCHTPVTASVTIAGDLRGVAENFSRNLLGSEKALDITKPKIKNFGRKNKALITNDDIIDMHNFLKEFDGDFGRTFKK